MRAVPIGPWQALCVRSERGRLLRPTWSHSKPVIILYDGAPYAARGCYELLQKSRRRADLRTGLTLAMTSANPLWKLICIKVHNTL